MESCNICPFVTGKAGTLSASLKPRVLCKCKMVIRPPSAVGCGMQFPDKNPGLLVPLWLSFLTPFPQLCRLKFLITEAFFFIDFCLPLLYLRTGTPAVEIEPRGLPSLTLFSSFWSSWVLANGAAVIKNSSARQQLRSELLRMVKWITFMKCSLSLPSSFHKGTQEELVFGFLEGIYGSSLLAGG